MKKLESIEILADDLVMAIRSHQNNLVTPEDSIFYDYDARDVRSIAAKLNGLLDNYLRTEKESVFEI